MTAKIDWYREVLELEPNSKIFFPLARQLAEEGQDEEAVELLEKGLRRHPEYLEARLLRIELLYRAGRKDECNAEVGKLSKMLASYAGFWQAWAACLASEEGQSDAASLLRFLAAHFISGPLKLHEVLNRGLDAMAKDGSLARNMPPASPELPDPAALLDQNPEAFLDDLDATLETVAQTGQPAAPEPEAAQAGALEKAEEEAVAAEADLPLEEPAVEAALPEPEDEPLPVVEPEAAQAGALEEAEEEAVAAEADLLLEEPAVEAVLPEPEDEPLPAVEPEAAQAEALEEVEEEAVAAEADLLLEEPAVEAVLPEPEDEPLPAVEPEAAQANEQTSNGAEKADSLGVEEAEAAMIAGLDLPEMVAAEPSSSRSASAEKVQEERLAALAEEADDDQEESFSLRTRSMAEVLAEQGDIQGALDIYQELAAAATSSDEVEDINRRIATLNTRLHMANASASFRAADAEAAAKSKEKLIGMLEALAQRVEARAQS